MYTHRYMYITITVGFFLLGSMPLRAQNPPAPKTERTEGVQRDPDSPVLDSQWSVVRSKAGNTETVTRVFQGALDARAMVIEQEKSVKVDDRNTSVTRTSYNLDPQGNRRPMEVVQEERFAPSKGEERVTRSISRPDPDGRLNIVRRETETRTLTAPGQWTTSTAILLPGINGGFSQAQAVNRVEREKAPGVTEVNQVSSLPDGNGSWTPVEQRAMTVTERKDSSRSEQEQVYRKDVNGQLALSERDLRSYQKDAAGREYWTTETYGGRNTGLYPSEGLPLERKITAVREKLPDGSERTVQRVTARNAQDPSAGLRPSGETVTTSKPLGGGVTEVVVEIKEADVNGNMKTIATRRTRISDH